LQSAAIEVLEIVAGDHGRAHLEGLAGDLELALAQGSLQAKNRVKAIFLDPTSSQAKLRLENRHFSREVAAVSVIPRFPDPTHARRTRVRSEFAAVRGDRSYSVE
jgi:hypothetical protein